MPSNKTRRFFRNKWLRRISLLLLVWLVAHLSYIITDGLIDRNDRGDVAIVLGNAVHPDGSLSSWLQGRVDVALRLYREGKVKKIFASGGIGMDKSEEGYPEGDAMKKYLVEHGVPDSNVIADNYGRNTYLTAKNFIAWNRQYHYSSAVVVSQFYHITRSKYILRKLGFQHVGNASSRRYSVQDIIGTLREVPAFYKYMIVY